MLNMNGSVPLRLDMPPFNRDRALQTMYWEVGRRMACLCKVGYRTHSERVMGGGGQRGSSDYEWQILGVWRRLLLGFTLLNKGDQQTMPCGQHLPLVRWALLSANNKPVAQRLGWHRRRIEYFDFRKRFRFAAICRNDQGRQ